MVSRDRVILIATLLTSDCYLELLFRVGFDSHVLRFSARLITDNPDDDKRYFIVKYFLCDDTMAVFELCERNSGFKVIFYALITYLTV